MSASFRGTNSIKALATTIALIALVSSSASTLAGEAGVGDAKITQRFAAMADAKASGTKASDTKLRVPSEYRKSYQFLGTWAVGDDAKSNKQMHVVYISPGSADAYRQSGHFPDGTIIVKEVYDAAVQQMTTGLVGHEDKLKGWFVMVRDSKNTHAGDKLWGDGWGWAWFDADKPDKTTSTDYTADCQSCHVPAQATDWIYTFGYPPLKK